MDGLFACGPVIETWEETSRFTGKTEEKSTRYVWISEKKLTHSNVETRCIKIGRYRQNPLHR